MVYLKLALVLSMAVACAESVAWLPASRPSPNFVTRHQYLVNVTHQHGPEQRCLFLGASDVENWLYDGKDVWNAHYAARHCFNYGIGGDRTENILWRIEHGELDGLRVKVVVLVIGSNNRDDRPEDIVRAQRAIVAAIKAKIAGVKILLLAVLPRGENNAQVHATNRLMVAEEDHQHSVYFLDMTTHFESRTEPGHVNTTLFLKDLLHFNHAGYQTWYETMEPTFAKLLA